MVSIFRSEDVDYCNVVIPTETAYEAVNAFGELECVEFVNLNRDAPTASLKFTPHVATADEIERKLRTLENILIAEKISPQRTAASQSQITLQRDLGAFESEIDRITDEINTSNNNIKNLILNYNDIVQYRQVLRCAEAAGGLNINPGIMPASAQQGTPTHPQSHTLSSGVIAAASVAGGISAAAGISLISVFGIIDSSRIIRFEQFLWRACRGNFFLRRLAAVEIIRDPITHERVPKTVFAVYIQGAALEVRVRKIAEVFAAAVYTVPDDDHERSQIGLTLMTRIRDFELIIAQTHETRALLLLNISKNLISYKLKIIKIKSIYNILNMFIFDPSGRSLRGDMWCPRVHLGKVRQKLLEIQRAQQNEYGAFIEVVKPPASPPTYFRVNRLTAGFQNLVDSYAVAAYKEVNPGLFMIITFPFLFSVMFGDFCHGLVIFIFGLYLVIKEKHLSRYENDEMFGLLFSGRYIILLMGLFSLYSGIIYNEFLSKALFIFGTGWRMPSSTTSPSLNDIKLLTNVSTHETVYLDPKIFHVDPYPIGMDPLWMFGVNKITFINSFKMKISIILGFFHMLFGILLSCVNHFYFGHFIDFIAEFVPQILFFVALFGYLVFLIFYKWITFSSFSKTAPSILLTFINMFFNFGKDIPESDVFYNGQKYVQMFLVVISVICIPWLLCLKPILLIIKKRRITRLDNIRASVVTNTSPGNHEEIHLSDIHPNIPENNKYPKFEDELDKGIGEISIMQMIHTIEFCLGGVSNTASYLRLWALSLAHSQLSELLWGVFRKALSSSNFSGFIIIVLILYPFLILSLSILVVMEGLSTFLHAIRLHWVEFQNKFYKGTGKPLTIFSFKELVKNIDID